MMDKTIFVRAILILVLLLGGFAFHILWLIAAWLAWTYRRHAEPDLNQTGVRA